MLKNYFKIALRNLLKNKGYTLINVAGLSLGLTCAMLIFALVRYHFSIDKQHRNYDNTYRVVTKFVSPEGDFHTTGVPFPLGKALINDHPQIQKLAMVQVEGDFFESVPVANSQDKKFKDEEQSAFVEPSFFEIFDYEWVAGSTAELKNPNTVVLSEKNALKYFNTTNVIGKTIKHNGRLTLKIVGVFKDYQDNTDFAFQVMPSYASLKEYLGEIDDDFGNNSSSTQCFVLLNEKFTKADWDTQMMAFVKKYNPDEIKSVRYMMQPLHDIYFSTDHGGVSKNLILSLLVIGIFLILTASINFVNLATAQALTRSKEVGVRKVLGSSKALIFWQFMAETVVITVIASLISFILFQFGQKFAQQNLQGAFSFTFYYDFTVIIWMVVIITGVIFLSGAYPAFILGGFNPVTALKGKISSQQVGGFSVRRSLVVVQFAITQMLIIGMAVVAGQLDYFQNKDLGFKKNAILNVRLPNVPEQDISKMSTFKNLVRTIPGVQKFSYSMSGAPQSGWVNSTSFKFDNRAEDEEFETHVKAIDADYVDLYNLKLIAGRNLQPSDTSREALVNETMVKRLGITNPAQIIGKSLIENERKLEIVGVVNDFNQVSLEDGIDPLFMTTRAIRYFSANIQVSANNFQRVIKQLENGFNQVYPDSYFHHEFVDEQIQRRYQQEQTMSKLINFFAMVAIAIGCLGLYGLVSFMIAQKRKEIGIRKVLGASIQSILSLFGKEFARLIILAFLIAAPIAWYVMHGWLQNYTYRISIGVGIFAISIGATFLIAAVTVGYQSIKAASTNPVKSLRTE